MHYDEDDEEYSDLDLDFELTYTHLHQTRRSGIGFGTGSAFQARSPVRKRTEKTLNDGCDAQIELDPELESICDQDLELDLLILLDLPERHSIGKPIIDWDDAEGISVRKQN